MLHRRRDTTRALAAGVLALALAGLPQAASAQGPSHLIPGAGDWTLTTVTNGGCFARLAGNQVDSMLMVNRDAKPVLAVGRPDWNFSAGDVSAQLRINGGAPHALTASPVGNIVLVVIDDDLKSAVLNATSLTWTLPNGRFSASVLGIGKAFKAVVPCGLAAAKAVPPATAPGP